MPGKTRPAFVLCRQEMSEDTVEEVYKRVPAGWSVIESEEPVQASGLGANVLFVLSGKEGRLRVRFTGGSSVGAFRVNWKELEALFARILVPK
jgi:hypothetical protein